MAAVIPKWSPSFQLLPAKPFQRDWVSSENVGLILFFFASAALFILFAGCSLFLSFHLSRAFYNATLGRRTRSGMIRPLESHIQSPVNQDSCPDISQRVSVVPWECGPNSSIAGQGVSDSERTQRSDSRVLLSFDFVHVLFFFDSVSLQRSVAFHEHFS